MTQAGWSRSRTIQLALAAALVAALVLLRRTGTDQPPPERHPLAVPSPRPIGASTVPSPRAAREPHAPPVVPPTEPASTSRPTPRVFDFAAMTPPRRTAAREDEDRFETNDWFTEEDLHHPERYFELAERMPELNRPEERRDTLDFFLAYREKRRRDLEAGGESPDQRQEMLASIERYDAAIARLRAIIDAERATE